jgi:general secretion pathway protein I
MWSGLVDALVCINNPKPSIQSGFSLLEVLLAFVIMGLVVAGILQLTGNSLRNVIIADEYSYAVQIAESKMAEVGNSISVEQGEHSGILHEKFKWQISITDAQLPLPEDMPPLSATPYLIAVDVTWPIKVHKHHFHLSSLRFGATP